MLQALPKWIVQAISSEFIIGKYFNIFCRGSSYTWSIGHHPFAVVNDKSWANYKLFVRFMTITKNHYKPWPVDIWFFIDQGRTWEIGFSIIKKSALELVSCSATATKLISLVTKRTILDLIHSWTRITAFMISTFFIFRTNRSTWTFIDINTTGFVRLNFESIKAFTCWLLWVFISINLSIWNLSIL